MSRSSRPFLLLVALSVVVAGALPASAGTRASASIDTWIAGPGGSAGVGLVSRSGSGQSLDSSVLAPETLAYTITADVTRAGATVSFVGGGGSPDFSVRYQTLGGSDITLAVTGRGYTVRKVAAGTSVAIRMIVQVRSSAAGSSGNLAVLASTSSTADMVCAFVTAT
jgi:hypothetical protein